MLNDIIALNGSSAKEFVRSLKNYAEESRAIEHPLLDDIAAGNFHNLSHVVTCFLREYYFYSYNFTQYLAAVMANLQLPEHRAQLMPNAMEEGGHISEEQAVELREAGLHPDDVRAPHTELFQRFLHEIGLSRREILSRPPHLATLTWIETFSALCSHGSQEQAIGALGIGTEGIVRPIYLKILQGIKKAWPHLTVRERAFFELHALVDEEHALVMRNITIDLAQTEAGRRAVAVGVLSALNVRIMFFDQMHEYLQAADVRDIHSIQGVATNA